MSAGLPVIAADWVHTALEWRTLVDALREAFRVGASAPLRASHPVTPAGDRLLLMPAWDRASLGVKIVTVFPRNLVQGLASVSALYLLFDAATGHPISLDYGFTTTRTATAGGTADTVRIPFARTQVPDAVRAYLMVDAYPAARATLQVPAS